MIAPPLLTLEAVGVTYQRSIVALHGIDLTVQAGQIVAILGVNGAGKTTTLRAISGFVGLDQARVTGGCIRHRGTAIETLPPHLITRRGIVLVPERDKVFPNLTVAENLAAVVTAAAGTAERRRREQLVYEHFPRLAARRSSEAGLLSGGERQMLAVGAALLCGPELLLIDELSLGLAPIIVGELGERLKTIRSELGLAILLVEQSAAFALQMADHAYVLENGRVAATGPAATLAADTDIQRYYLGTAAGERRSYRDGRTRPGACQ